MFDMFTPLNVFEELRFIIELILGELILVFPFCKKRDHFVIKFSISTILMLLLSQGYLILIGIFSSLNLNGIVIQVSVVIWYCFLTILTCFYLTFCFKFSFEQSLLYTSVGYALQHIEYTFINEWIALTLFPDLRNQLWLYFIICLFSYALLLIPIYFLAAKKFKNIGNIYAPEKRSTIVMYTIMLIITLFLTFSGQTIYRSGDVLNPNYLGLAIEFLTCFLILFAVYLLLYENKRQNEKEVINHLLYENKKQYQLKKESIDLINHKCHDLKHQIEDLKNMQTEDRNETLNKLQKEIMIYDINIHTNNDVLDIILMEKQLYCINKNIRLSYLGNAEQLKFIESIDIYTLFGNALDNALEAVEKLDDNNKMININVDTYLNNIMISIVNFYDGKLNVDNGQINTTKEDVGFHGYGISSIKSIVKKYHGVTNISYHNNVFTLKILIPYI